ncbi:DNA cytosine methyltransferase [Streptomyces sp. 4N509B]|uniref:DNA cytosine methyltransferase n=1 Tax=Streptomyces sp. 4N509B TaxID=3457413 RepID=UPI003FD10C10
MSLTFTDIFCGAGGSSTGLVAAGYELKLAANHWKTAIETHAANHRDADHLCADINNYDMRRLPKTDVLWASPICTEISPAGGRRRTRGQLALDLEEDGHVPDAAWERTRATAYDVIRATEVHRYKAVLVENVLEFVTDWELFGWWRQGMELLGYRSQIVSVSAAHVGGSDDDAAPQWRDRIYVVFTREGIPVPDMKPRPLAHCEPCGEDVRAVQSWRNGRRVGKYRQQYDYRCPNARCRHAIVEPYVRPAASVIDWSNLGVRIGDRAAHGLRPLAANTIKRIRAGLAMLGERRAGVLVPAGGQWNNSPTSTAEPMRTRMANPKGYEALCTPPGLVIPYRNASTRTTAEPLHTLSTVDSAGLVPHPVPAVEDCRYRMVQPREQLLAQRFPADYVVHGSKGEQTMQAGNAVPVNVAQWVGRRVEAVL